MYVKSSNKIVEYKLLVQETCLKISMDVFYGYLE